MTNKIQDKDKAVEEFLQNSANPYIRGERKSSFDHDLKNFWRWACKDLKLFPDPNGRYTKLGGLFDLMFKENQSPKFLMHTFTVDHNGIKLLKNGESLDFKMRPKGGFQSENEYAFSLHGCATGWYRIGGILRREDEISKGIAIFNNQFHEKIYSRNISDGELNRLLEIYTESVKKQDSHIDKRTKGLDYWGWCRVLEATPNLHEFMDTKALKKIIKTVDSIPITTYIKDKGFPIIGLKGIDLLRKGDFYGHSNDSGLRAVRISNERDFQPLPITPEDIKYLVAFDDSKHKIDYEVFNHCSRRVVESSK